MSDYDAGYRAGANAAYRSLLARIAKWLVIAVVVMGILDSLAYLIGKLIGT